jgi:hypothetical protein
MVPTWHSMKYRVLALDILVFYSQLMILTWYTMKDRVAAVDILVLENMMVSTWHSMKERILIVDSGLPANLVKWDGEGQVEIDHNRWPKKRGEKWTLWFPLS